MTKSLVNLIGAAVTAGILLLGILVFALPLFSSANATMSAAADVAQQNRTQQAVLEALTAQADDMPAIEDELAELRRGIPATEHIEDVIELAAAAVDAHGGTLVAVRPADAVVFAPRTADVVAAETTGDVAPAPAAPATADEGSGSETPESADAVEATAPEAGEAPTGPQQVAVTVEIDVADVAAATAVLDALRTGPRLLTVSQATVQNDEDGVTLTATVSVLFRP